MSTLAAHPPAASALAAPPAQAQPPQAQPRQPHRPPSLGHPPQSQIPPLGSFSRSLSPSVAARQQQQQQQQHLRGDSSGSSISFGDYLERPSDSASTACAPVTDRYSANASRPLQSIAIDTDQQAAARAARNTPHAPTSRPSSAASVSSAPPSRTLGSLPSLSPISPLEGSSLARFTIGAFSPQDNGGDEDQPDTPIAWPSSLVAPGVARHSTTASFASLQDIVAARSSPSPLTPTKGSFDLPAAARLRDSPSVPRRRTLVEVNPATKRVSPARATRVSTSGDDYTATNGSNPQGSPSPTPKRLSRTRAHSLTVIPGLAFPEPRLAQPSPSTSTAVDAQSSTSASPTSKKRSLPRPPVFDNQPTPTQNRPSLQHQQQHSLTDPIIPISMPVPVSTRPTQPLQLSPKANMATLGVMTTEPLAMKQPVRQAPRSAADTRSFATPAATESYPQAQLKSSSAPTPMPMPFNPSHRPTNSASNFPAIAGLADAGPYPTAQASRQPAGVPLPGAPSGAVQFPQGFRPGEEVCLECMMRDRDLADIDVIGEGVWERESDVAWESLKEREQDVLRAMSADDALSTSGFSLEDASTLESEMSVSSPRSHGSDDAQRAATIRKQQRDARRTRREGWDQQIAAIGWRGFKWEEGAGGDGFPKGFRGTRPGALTERGIKNVLTIYPASAALRYQILQSYLRGQYRLIIELRQESQRLGHYPEPEELKYPSSPTTSSHESLQNGSVTMRKKRNSVERGAPSIKAPSISTARSAPVTMTTTPTLRQSPSTPAGLGTQVTKMRPKTQYIEREREPLRLNTGVVARPPLHYQNSMPNTRPAHFKVPSTSSMPKGRESKYYAGDDWSDTEDLWPPPYEDPSSPGSGHLRPFSFAVNAHARQREGSIGSHRRSVFGRFGDSVTSFFTGSQGGSGSMIDMHLGLDMDRRNRTSSYQAHEPPKALVSAGRPPMVSRQSLGAPPFLNKPPEDLTPRPAQARPRSVSTSRLTQVSVYDDQDSDEPKKKGFKGLLQKMKGKGGKKDRRESVAAAKADEDGGSSDLAPPPPMNFLVNRGDRDHSRQRSTSSISMANDSQGSIAQPGSPAMQSGRSVSAPLGSSGSDASPTSSRFQADRETGAPRRRTDPQVELPPGAAEAGYMNRGSGMEMLTGGSSPGVSPEAQTSMLYEEPQPMTREVRPDQAAQGNQRESPGNTHPPAYRKSQQPSLSSRFSTSTTTFPAVETPDPASSATYLLPTHGSASSLSPNRFKNLPPLPPGFVPDNYDEMRARESMYDRRMSGSSHPRASMMSDSPTVHRTGVPPSHDYFPTASPRYHTATLSPAPGQSSPSSIGSAMIPTPLSVQPSPPQQLSVLQPRTLQPRASYDALADRPRVSVFMAPNGYPEDRNSVYLEHSAAASTGSFGRYMKSNEKISSSVPVNEDRKERRRGIKSIFSKAR